jgi:DNA-binding winged helix-turn-helix (wHTH) protein
MRVRFGEFVLDSETRTLERGGQPVRIGPKPYELLELLIRCRPKVLSKGEIRRRVWPDTLAGDANLNVLVGELRAALCDDAKSPRFIRTAFGFGYAFSGEVVEDGPAAVGAAQPRIVWERKVIPLLEGENVLGRDDEATVRIDAPGVSRRHARIRLTRGAATLEDLGSKNGTFVRDARLDGPVLLADGATIPLGRMVLVYRCGPEPGSTLTEAAR